MKRALLALSLLLAPVIVVAQDTPPPATTAKTKGMSGDEATKLVDKDATVKDAVEDGVAVVNAVKDLADADSDVDNKLLITALLAAIFKFLLDAIKLTGKFSDKAKEFFASQTGRIVLRLSTLVLGAGVMLVANLAAGVPWIEAVIMGLGAGPGALAVNEAIKIVPGIGDKKPAAG